MSDGTPKLAIFEALVGLMRDVEPIAKEQKNTQQNYNFRGVDAVYNAIQPLMAKHGVFSTSTILAASNTSSVVKTRSGESNLHHAILRMRFTYWAADGSNVSTEVVGEGMDYNGDKASNKAMSVADKYALLQLLKIPTACIDSDKVPHEAPDAKPNAPKTQPRNDRCPQQDFDTLKRVWAGRREERGLEIGGPLFAKWCLERQLCAEKDALALASWSVEMVAEARRLINQEMPEGA